MRALAFSDVHRDLDAVRTLAERARDAHVLIGAGDFAAMRLGLPPVIDAIADLDRPTVLVHGNAESDDELREACAPHEHLHPLHGTAIELGGRVFFGLGAAVPVTPFGAWSVDLTEEDAERLLAPCPPGAVLVTHAPPHGHCDAASDGVSMGSRAILACVERTRPSHALCGHVHAAWGRTSLVGSTTVMNLGPRGAQVDLGP